MTGAEMESDSSFRLIDSRRLYVNLINIYGMYVCEAVHIILIYLHCLVN